MRDAGVIDALDAALEAVLPMTVGQDHGNLLQPDRGSPDATRRACEGGGMTIKGSE